MSEKIIVGGEIVDAEEHEEIDVELEEAEEDSEDTEDGSQETVEEWMKTEDDPETQTPGDPSKIVPVSKFVSMKKKLRGQVSEKQDEIERLRRENEQLKAPNKENVRPNRYDFHSDEDYDAAIDAYYDRRFEENAHRYTQQTRQKTQIEDAKRKIAESVDSHYNRAANLIETSGINPEIYKNADTIVRSAVEKIRPGIGDSITDEIISILGEGSEKVIYYLGRNEAALNKFQSLLVSDPTGMQAAVYLGGEKQRLTNPKKPISQAPAPAAQIQGDAIDGSQARALKKAYTDAHNKGDTQKAYNIKKEAKAAKLDVSKW